MLYSHSFLFLFLLTIYLIRRESHANRSDEILETLEIITRLESVTKTIMENEHILSCEQNSGNWS
jgi:hypothetical protein